MHLGWDSSLTLCLNRQTHCLKGLTHTFFYKNALFGVFFRPVQKRLQKKKAFIKKFRFRAICGSEFSKVNSTIALNVANICF